MRRIRCVELRLEVVRERDDGEKDSRQLVIERGRTERNWMDRRWRRSASCMRAVKSVITVKEVRKRVKSCVMSRGVVEEEEELDMGGLMSIKYAK